MGERGARRGAGAGAPFYAPPRRKTSAEIISEARAAIYGDMSGASSGAGSGGALRPLRTRRPFTPREPQRTLFGERTRKKDPRPPSAFDLKYLSLSESSEDVVASIAELDDELTQALYAETHNARKKPAVSKQHIWLLARPALESFVAQCVTVTLFRKSRNPRTGAGAGVLAGAGVGAGVGAGGERAGELWGGFPKLPHLSGKSKPLHRRNTTGPGTPDGTKNDFDLAHAISVTRPLGGSGGDDMLTSGYGTEPNSKSLSPDPGARRKQFATTKALSYDAAGYGLGNIAVRHLAVQLPNASPSSDLDSMTVLELAETLAQRTDDVDRTVQLMEALQVMLETSPPANSLRDLVLRSFYTHIDSNDERVLVAIARAMLTMRVTGGHLAAACKLVFKIARNDKNDHFFRNTNLLELLVEGCGRADPLSEGECCVYGAGALRFLALEPRLCALAHRAGALHLAALHLKILNNAKAENPRGVSEQSTHALYQLTGALRNLAGGEREPRAFVASGALAELLAALAHHTDRDVLTNVARCLSVLSADSACCAWLCAAPTSAGALLRALAACAARAPLAVRLAYTLGNMAAADEQARLNIYNELGGVDVLLTILESYTKRSENEMRDHDTDPDVHLVGTDMGGSDGSNEDVLIKTVRVVANLCLCERAGRGLAAAHAERTMRALLACLELAEKPSDAGSEVKEAPEADDRREELATAALATLNNVTFYREPPAPPDPLDDTIDQLCKVTCRWLVGGGGGAACEAARALGNLSRAPRAAQLIVLHGALDALPAFLHHEEASVRCAAAGVLVNVCGSGAAAGAAGGVAARALGGAAAAGDAPAAALLARALWNAHAHCPLAPAHQRQAAAALAMFIDDESVFAACEASSGGERRASDPEIKHHVKFDLENNNYPNNDLSEFKTRPLFVKAHSFDRELHLETGSEDEGTGCSGEDLGFEEGDMLVEDGCDCGPCRRLAAWEEVVGVAIPLLEKLRPPRADASTGTD